MTGRIRRFSPGQKYQEQYRSSGELMFSLNEVEAMGRRSAHGAGLYWGVAEEAGKAIRWLAAHGLPGPELLAKLLKSIEHRGYSEFAPTLTDRVLRAESGALSPLVAGAVLSDLAAEIAVGREFKFEATRLPLLIAPYAAFSAKLKNITIELCWHGAKLTMTPDSGLLVEGDTEAINVWSVDNIFCQPVAGDIATELPGEKGRAVDTETWDCLNTFAYRAFAPSTESSRLGAGARLIDND